MKRRALLSTFAATGASVGLAGCGSSLSGCRRVGLALVAADTDAERERVRSQVVDHVDLVFQTDESIPKRSGPPIPMGWGTPRAYGGP